MHMDTTNRIGLARELAHATLEDFNIVEAGNSELFELLEGNDYTEPYFPGDTAEAIRSNIVTAFELASQPVPFIKTGGNREFRRRRAQSQRARLHLLCRVALALLEPRQADESGDAAAKLAAIKAILEGGKADGIEPTGKQREPSMSAPQLVEHYGVAFRVLATFPEGDTDAANAYMAAHTGAALLCIRDGVAYLAHEDDRGQPLTKAKGAS